METVEVGYSADRLARVRQQAIAEAATRPAKTAMLNGDGVIARRIPKEAYFNAVVNHGEDPHDEGYWSDMERLYPECKVAYQPRNTTVQVNRAPSGVSSGVGRMTRFGRVTFHKRYG